MLGSATLKQDHLVGRNLDGLAGHRECASTKFRAVLVDVDHGKGLAFTLDSTNDAAHEPIANEATGHEGRRTIRKHNVLWY